MTTYRRLWIILPKGLIGWGLLVFATALGLQGVPTIEAPQRLLLALGVLILPLVLLFLVPARFLALWERAPWPLRGVCLGLIAYVIVVTASSFSELYTFDLWGKFLLPGGLTPWSPANTAGFFAALTAFATQHYFVNLTPSPQDGEVLIRGTHFISFEEAQKRAAALRAQKTGGKRIPPVEDPARN